MAIYRSNLVLKKTPNRGLYAGKDETRSGRIFIPAGTVLTNADTLLFVPMGESQFVKKVTLLVNGDTAAGAGSIGRFQIKDRNGDPVVVERMGPYGEASTKFVSPADAPAEYKAAGQLDGYTETIVAAPVRLAGKVNVGIQITTGFTAVTDTELFLGVMFAGETSQVEVNAPYLQSYSDNSYLIGQ